jgi:hypothetical protein
VPAFWAAVVRHAAADPRLGTFCRVCPPPAGAASGALGASAPTDAEAEAEEAETEAEAEALARRASDVLVVAAGGGGGPGPALVLERGSKWAAVCRGARPRNLTCASAVSLPAVPVAAFDALFSVLHCVCYLSPRPQRASAPLLRGRRPHASR